MRILGLATFLVASFMTAAIASPTSIGNVNTTCKGGGTRDATGTYDPSTGAVNFNIVMTACIDSLGDQHDGTVSVTGNAAPTAAGSTVYQFTNLTYAFNTLDTLGAAGGSTARTCTWTKNGTFDTSSNLFNGTIVKTNCTLSITNEKEAANILEHALRKATVSDGS
jgi:hypothetical protein